MADISKELAAIMAAIYGREVRGSIHDAIEKINDATEVALLAGTDIGDASSSTTGYFSGSLYINTNTWSLWQCQGTEDPDTLHWVDLGQFGGHDGRAIVSIDKTGTGDQPNIDEYTITYSEGEDSYFYVTNGIDGTHGSVWYKGTAITGTGSGLTGFPGVQTDMYMNTSTGYIYQCTQTGDGTSAKWEYSMALGGGGGGAANLDDLGDVDLQGVSEHQKLKYEYRVVSGVSTLVWTNMEDDAWSEEQYCYTGNTYKDFTVDTSHAYDVYFDVPNEVIPPVVVNTVAQSNTVLRVTFSEITSEQAGSAVSPAASTCKIKLRKLV